MWGVIGRWFTPQPVAKQLRELTREPKAGFEFTSREQADEYLLFGKYLGEAE